MNPRAASLSTVTLRATRERSPSHGRSVTHRETLPRIANDHRRPLCAFTGHRAREAEPPLESHPERGRRQCIRADVPEKA